MFFLKSKCHNKISIALLFTLFSAISMFAQLSGKVTEKETKEPIVGAIIKIASINKAINSGLDGSFNFKNIPSGKYTIACTYIGFDKKQKTIELEGTEKNLNFELEVEENEIKEVVIHAKRNKESEKYSLDREKNADNILNSIGAKTIQLLPDITTASVLQRVSGVSLERTSTGEARYAIIRGMDKRYNYTLVNGVKIPSPDNKFRYVPMDMFPAELLERLEVSKALTPDMEGDAIGGAMNLVMKNAKNNFSLQANVGTGFSQLLADRKYSNFDKNEVNFNSPVDINGKDYQATPNDFNYKIFDYKTKNLPLNTILGLTVSNRFGKQKRFGAIVAASYQNTFKGSDNIWFKPENQPGPGNIPAFTDYYNRKYNTNVTRYGIHSKLDYILNKSNKLSLYNVYLNSEEAEARTTIDTSLSIGRSGVGTGNTYKSYRSKLQRQSIYNSTLQGENNLTKKLELDWSAVYSLAKSATPDWSEYQTVEQVGFDIDGKQYATEPKLNIPFYRIWTHNTDRDYMGIVNFEYKETILNKDIAFKFGGLYRDKLRENFYNEWDLIPASGTGTFTGTLSADLFTPFVGATAAQGSPNNALTYTATEKIIAYYLQAKFNLTEKFSFLGGVRYESTEQGWKTAQDPKVTLGALGTVPYSDYLPSVHLKYNLSPIKSLRLSYFAAINRPGFYEYIPSTVRDDNFTISGNPYLKHTTSNNFDFRYEVFPKGLDQFLIGAFYKNIINPIENGIKFNGTSSATLQPENYGTATNFGFEFTFAKYFGKIGFSGNYTYTNSQITTSKLYYNQNNISENTSQTRPLQGQSPHIANASVLYKNQDSGLDIQLSYVYTGTRIALLSPYKDLDYWQQATSQLDFSLEKKFMKKFTFYTKINNILNTPVYMVINQPNIYTTGKFALPNQTSTTTVTTQKDYFGQNYLVGLRYKIN